jgi:hypothetical protein
MLVFVIFRKRPGIKAEDIDTGAAAMPAVDGTVAPSEAVAERQIRE